jgi:hypothetical protein
MARHLDARHEMYVDVTSASARQRRASAKKRAAVIAAPDCRFARRECRASARGKPRHPFYNTLWEEP